MDFSNFHHKVATWVWVTIATGVTVIRSVKRMPVQWRLVQMLNKIPLTSEQQSQAVTILKYSLEAYDDWIVVNLTFEALATLARKDADLRQEFPKILRQFQYSPKKSIASRVRKLLREF